MNTIDRIADLVAKKKITEKQFLNDIGLNKSAMSDWRGGTTKSYKKHLDKIADYFGVSTDYLLGREEKTDEWIRKNAIPVGEMGIMPVLGRVCAGNGVLAEEDIIGYEAVDNKFCNDQHLLLQISGDSMYPKLEEGDLAIIRKQSSVDSGDVGVFMIDDEEGVVKKVVYDKEYIELHSFNPMYPIMRFNGSEVLRVRVVGKLVQSIKKW